MDYDQTIELAGI